MKQESRPLYLQPATFVPNKKTIRFRRLDGNFLDSHKQQELLWKILELSTGKITQAVLLQRLADAFPDLDEKVLRGAVAQLFAAEVLVDSIAAFDVFHQYTNNPVPFTSRLSASEAVEHVKSARLAVKEGVARKVTPKEKSALAKLQMRRRTVRSFDNTPVTLGEIGHILTTGYSILLHSTPSAGALYPLKLYAIVLRDAEDLKAGYYEYDPETHQIVLFNGTVNRRRVAYSLNDERLLGAASVVIAIAADMKRNQPKYSTRGYRLLLLEAGHAAQNMQLAATEQQLGCFEYGGFQDEGLARLLDMNNTDKQRVLPLITLAIGKPAAGQKLHSSLSDLSQKLQKEVVGDGAVFESVGSVDLPDLWLRHAFLRTKESDGSLSYAAGGTSESVEVAAIKALAEAYERRVSGEVRVDREATPTELTKKGERWLDPRTIAPQTKEHFGKKGLMQAFTEDTKVQWVKGRAIKDGRDVWAPIDLVYYPLHAHEWGRKAFSWSSSSGVAAFTDKKTAIEKAFLELLERHCLMLLWHQRKQPKLIPAKLLSEHWQERIIFWEKRGRNVHILDISSGYGEVTLKVIIESDTMYPHYVNGAASSFVSFDHALEKAFQEAQTAVETVLHSQPETSLKPEEVQSVANHGEFYAHSDHKDKMAWAWQGTYARALPKPRVSAEKLLKTLDAVVIELTPQGAPLYVVRVISEKLVPIGFGFGNTHHLHRALDGRVQPESLTMPHDFA